eukprot:2410108-Amphidinium_carterae.1
MLHSTGSGFLPSRLQTRKQTSIPGLRQPMSGPTGNPYASNRHADVLGEDPSDVPAKLRLVEE